MVHLEAEADVGVGHPPDGLDGLKHLLVGGLLAPHEEGDNKGDAAGDALHAVHQHLAATVERPLHSALQFLNYQLTQGTRPRGGQHWDDTLSVKLAEYEVSQFLVVVVGRERRRGRGGGAAAAEHWVALHGKPRHSAASLKQLLHAHLHFSSMKCTSSMECCCR